MKSLTPLALVPVLMLPELSPGQSIPNPIVYPGLFGPSGDRTVTPPSIPVAGLFQIGGSVSGDLGTYWNATATGGAVVGTHVLTELRVAESGAQVALTGSSLKFNLSNNPDSILGALGTGVGLALTWSATATFDEVGNPLVLEPDSTYRISFQVDAGDGLLNSTLAISPSFAVELLNGAGDPVGFAGGGTTANLIGLELLTVVGAPAGSGTAVVDFRTGATVPAGPAGIRFSASATLPASIAGIGTEFATISELSVGEIDDYTLWIEDNEVPSGQSDRGDDPDGDGRSNLDEFAVASDPMVGDGNNIVATVGDPDGPGPESSVFVMTLPVRAGADFSADGGDQVALVDGIDYRVEGSFDLLGWDLAVTELAPNDGFANPLPALPAGWTYRSFRVPGQTSDTPRAFLRLMVD
jgi:hypothetical protein